VKLALLSDLHLDHDQNADEAWLNGLKPQPEVDVMVLAGDWFSICRPQETKDLFLMFLDLYNHILVVPGNHEMWRSSIEHAEAAIVEAAGNSGRITLCLRPQYVTIKGQRFFAGTLWYRKPGPDQLQHFIDYDYIQGHDNGTWMFEQQRLFEEGLYQDQRPFSTTHTHNLSDTIVVSHHLPHPRSTPAIYRGSPADHFFMCDLTQAIYDLKPKLFLHGHTHTPCDYVVGDTRVVAQPRGYPWEHRKRPPYEPKLIEVL
jgi:predicted phosphodiesterase